MLGFTLGWLSLEKVPFQSARALAEDPPARLTDVGPGARDLPSASGSAASTSTVLMARRRIRELEQAAGRSPNDYGLLVQLGNASYDAEDWQRAVETYERAVKIKSDDANVLTDLGISHRNLGHIDRAIELFDHAIRADPKHWPALFNLAIVYGLDKGDVSKANAILRTLKKEHPDVQSLDRLEKTLEAKGRNAR